MRTILLALLLATPAAAEDVLSDVTGNWAAPGNDGFFYRAVLSAEGDHLRLRIWQGMSPDALGDAPQLDNAKIAYRVTQPTDRSWLEVAQDGTLLMRTTAFVENYLYAEEVQIRMLDFQFTVSGFAFYNNRMMSTEVPDEPFACFSDECYACIADVWSGIATAGGEPVAVPPVGFEEKNASLWGPESIHALGYCPAPN